MDNIRVGCTNGRMIVYHCCHPKWWITSLCIKLSSVWCCSKNLQLQGSEGVGFKTYIGLDSDVHLQVVSPGVLKTSLPFLRNSTILHLNEDPSDLPASPSLARFFSVQCRVASPMQQWETTKNRFSWWKALESTWKFNFIISHKSSCLLLNFTLDNCMPHICNIQPGWCWYPRVTTRKLHGQHQKHTLLSSLVWQPPWQAVCGSSDSAERQMLRCNGMVTNRS